MASEKKEIRSCVNSLTDALKQVEDKIWEIEGCYADMTEGKGSMISGWDKLVDGKSRSQSENKKGYNVKDNVSFMEYDVIISYL